MPWKGQQYCSRSCAKYAMPPENRHRKLTQAQVDEIRQRYIPQPKMAALAREYKVSEGLISRVINHKGWKQYPEDSGIPAIYRKFKTHSAKKPNFVTIEELKRRANKMLWLAVLCFLPSTARAENAQLNSAIQTLSTTTVALSGHVASLSQSQQALIQKYHLTNAGQCGLFVVGVSTGTAGRSIPVTLSFLPPTSTITSVQADLLISSSFTMTGATLGPAGVVAGKSIQTSNVNGMTRVLIFGLNTTPIGVGVLATLNFSSVATTPKNIYPITMSNLVASDPNGGTSLLCGVSGAIKL